MNSRKKYTLIEELTALLKEEHAGCEDNTCIIRNDFAEQYPIVIFEDFASSGAASKKFSRLFGELRSCYKSWWKLLRRDCGRLCRNVPHQTCSCNAVIWDLYGDYNEGNHVRCASCNKALNWHPETD